MELESWLNSLSTEEIGQLDALLQADKSEVIWRPMISEANPEVDTPQRRAFESEADVLLYGGSAGGGKALCVKTLLPTPSGYTTIGEVGVGDYVISGNGKPTKVIAKSDVFTDHDCYEITFSDGASVIADADHKWITSTCSERDGKSKSTESVRTTKEIFKTKKYRLHNNHAVRVFGGYAGRKKNFEIDPYLLGIWLGDGSSYKGEITSADPEVREAFHAAGYRTHTRETLAFGVYGLVTKLRKLNLINNKHIPQWCLRASFEQRLSLLQGLMDSDGYADCRGQCEFTTTKECLAIEVKDLICSLGIKANICEGRATIGGKDCGPKYRIKFMSEHPCFRLDRKLSRQKTEGFRGTTYQRYIVGVKAVPPVPVQCIQVADESSTYLCTENWIPTHNSDLLIGLALTAHHRTIIFRKQQKDLLYMVERIMELRGGREGYNGQDNRFKLEDGRYIKMGGMQHPGDEQSHHGTPYDLMAFDEVTELREYQFRYVQTWNRSAKDGQRSRIVCTCNPPTTAEGEWVIAYWAPWLDDTHPNPAQPGELRWFVSTENGDMEVDGPGEVEVEGQILLPKSRTFIPSSVDDNPFLLATGYKTNLMSLPEPMRSQMLHGDFLAGREADPWQVIPTKWVDAAFERWKNREKPKTPQSAIGVDVARGGKDEMVIAPRYDNYYDTLKVKPGHEITDGPDAVAFILSAWRDGSAINLDAIGVGGSPLDHLKGNNIAVNALVGNEASHGRDKTGSYGFCSKRSEWYWRLREALDPDSEEDICLPPDPQLKADLCAPKFKILAKGIQVESKVDTKHRLGKTIGLHKGDAVVYALASEKRSRRSKQRNVVNTQSKYNPLKW